MQDRLIAGAVLTLGLPLISLVMVSMLDTLNGRTFWNCVYGNLTGSRAVVLFYIPYVPFGIAVIATGPTWTGLLEVYLVSVLITFLITGWWIEKQPFYNRARERSADPFTTFWVALGFSLGSFVSVGIMLKATNILTGTPQLDNMS